MGSLKEYDAQLVEGSIPCTNCLMFTVHYVCLKVFTLENVEVGRPTGYTMELQLPGNRLCVCVRVRECVCVRASKHV